MNPNGDIYKEGYCQEEGYDSGALTVRRTLLSISTMCDFHVRLRTIDFHLKSILSNNIFSFFAVDKVRLSPLRSGNKIALETGIEEVKRNCSSWASEIGFQNQAGLQFGGR